MSKSRLNDDNLSQSKPKNTGMQQSQYPSPIGQKADIQKTETNPVKIEINQRKSKRELVIPSENYFSLFRQTGIYYQSSKKSESSLGKVATSDDYYFEETLAIPVATEFLQKFWLDDDNDHANKRIINEKCHKNDQAIDPCCISFVLASINDKKHCFIALSSIKRMHDKTLLKISNFCNHLNSTYNEYKFVPMEDNKLILLPGIIEYQYNKNDKGNNLLVRFINMDNKQTELNIPLNELREFWNEFSETQKELGCIGENKRKALDAILKYLEKKEMAPQKRLKVEYHFITGELENFNKVIAKININLPHSVQVSDETKNNCLTINEKKSCTEKYFSLLLNKLYLHYGKDIFVDGVVNCLFYSYDIKNIHHYGKIKEYKLVFCSNEDNDLNMSKDKIYLYDVNGKISYSMIDKHDHPVLLKTTNLDSAIRKSLNEKEFYDTIHAIANKNNHVKLNMIDSDPDSHKVRAFNITNATKFIPISKGNSFMAIPCCSECKKNKKAIMLTFETAQDIAQSREVKNRPHLSPIRNSFYNKNSSLIPQEEKEECEKMKTMTRKPLLGQKRT